MKFNIQLSDTGKYPFEGFQVDSLILLHSLRICDQIQGNQYNNFGVYYSLLVHLTCRSRSQLLRMSNKRKKSSLPPPLLGQRDRVSRTAPDDASFFVENIKPKREPKFSSAYYNAIGTYANALPVSYMQNLN